MAPKRPATVSGSKPKCKRKMLTIKEKIELLDMLEERRSYAAVGRYYGISESTVRYIKKEEKNIRSTAMVTFNKMAKRVMTPRNKLIVKMESALALWIHDCRKENISLDTNTIRTKALQLYDRMAENTEDQEKEDNKGYEAGSSTSTKSEKFAASKGWFDKFQKRYGLKSVGLHGVGKTAAEEYVNNTFKEIIKEEGCQPEQVFNMDETGLFWKSMPPRTFIIKEEATAEDVNDLLDVHGQPLTDKGLEELTKSAREEEKEEEERAEEEEVVGLTLERLATLQKKAQELQQLAEEWDTNMVRSLRFRDSIDGCMSAYKTMLTQAKKQHQQLPIDMSITRTKTSVTTTPSAEVPGEGL
nr:PREDICTED: tigger transposable element-derived protein 1 isoform X2 [Anolis carolinensis]|eukprot:XP_003228935.1 PREDICTED: tigger transposable element-derived protein 1 isoform X2 [Anolis carolinensis]